MSEPKRRSRKGPLLPEHRDEAPGPQGGDVVPAAGGVLPAGVEPATYEQVLAAAASWDPLSQEVMIAQRLASLPNQREGGNPVNIPRQVRGPWAHQLRKLGLYCLPELATHEMVVGERSGIMANHMGAELKPVVREDLWAMAKRLNPKLADLVDNADTPEARRAAMNTLAERLPVEQRLAMERLAAMMPEEFEPGPPPDSDTIT